jgi:alkylation response protein AidB-like acyl-CoA dehydrogenase/acyl carrier protein
VSFEYESGDRCAWIVDYCNRRANFRLMDERRGLAPHLVLEFGRRGLLGLTTARAFGGRGATMIELLEVLRCLGGIDATAALFVGLANVLGARPIERGGSATLKERLLPEIAAGRMLAAFALTEPSAGSFPQAIAATARRRPGGWMLEGQKWFSGVAGWSGVVNTFFRSAGDHGAPGPMTAFCLPTDRAGVHQGAEALTMGMRAMIQNEIRFEGVLAGEGDVLGREGEGLAVAQDAMGLGRLAIAGSAVGAMGQCLEIAHRYAAGRRISTGRLSAHPHARGVLWDIAGSAAALERLTWLVAALYDAGGTPAPEILALCKIIGGDEAFRAADLSMQILGGRGYLESEQVARTFRDARVLRIFEGPSEALLHHVGASALRGGGALWDFLADTLAGADLAARLRDVLARHAEQGDATQDRRLAIRFLAGRMFVCAAHFAAGRLPGAASPGPAQAALAERFDEACERFAAKLALLEQGANEQDLSVAVGARVFATAPGAQAPLEEDRHSRLMEGTASPAPRAGAALEVNAEHAVLIELLRQHAARVTRLAVSAIELDTSFSELGFDSVDAAEFAMALEQPLDREIDPTLLWSFPTLRALAAHLSAPRARSSNAGAAGTEAPVRSALAERLRRAAKTTRSDERGQNR